MISLTDMFLCSLFSKVLTVICKGICKGVLGLCSKELSNCPGFAGAEMGVTFSTTPY